MTTHKDKTNVENKSTSLYDAKSKKKSGKKYYSKSNANKALHEEGWKVIYSLSDEERALISSKSGTLHFICLLGLASRKSNRSLRGYKFKDEDDYIDPNQDRHIDASTPVGITLKSDEDITVPIIKMELVKKLMSRKKEDEPNTLFDVNNDIERYEHIKAGKEFHLSLYEFMFLILRPEYGGLFELNGDPRGAQLEPKTTKAVEIKSDGTVDLISEIDEKGNVKVKLPTPTIQFYAKGIGYTPKSTMVDIDQNGPNGWEIKPEYDRFKGLMDKDSANRSNKKKSTSESKKTKFAVTTNRDKDFIKKAVEITETTLAAIAIEKYVFTNPIYRRQIKDANALISLGRSVFESMSDTEREHLGSQSGMLHFENRLNYVTMTRNRIVGFRLWSDNSIQIPIIPITKDADTDIKPDTDITFRTVNAGERFDLSLFELMYLVISIEYGGYFEAFGDPKGVYLSVDLSDYANREKRLPQPSFKFSDQQSLKELKSIDISYRSANGIIIHTEFQEKFGQL